MRKWPWFSNNAAVVRVYYSTSIWQDFVYLNINWVCRIGKNISKYLTSDSTQPSVKESSSVARSVGTKTVSNQMHVTDLTSRPYHHVNNETELSPYHPGVWHCLVVIWRRGSLSPCHDNDIEIILAKKYTNQRLLVNENTLFQVFISASSSWDRVEPF